VKCHRVQPRQPSRASPTRSPARGIAIALTLLAGAAVADDLALVPASANWRWWPGRSEASTPVEGWRSLSFNDAAWAAGTAGFALDTSADETTVLPAPTDFNAVFFRQRFIVEEPASIAWLLLRIDYTGGFVAYLNGLEVARRGLGAPSTPVLFNTPAEPHTHGVPEEIDLTAWTWVLRPGANILAVQWHNPVPVPWGAVFVPELRANFRRGPFLQNTTATTQTLVWLTAAQSSTAVEYGPTPALGWRYEADTPTNTHVASLTGLAPDTTYYYRVLSTVGGRTGRSPVGSFRTFRIVGGFSFVALADVGSGTAAQRAVARVVQDLDPDLVLMPGDLVYPRFVPELVDFHFFSLYDAHMRSRPFFVAAGNHDVLYSGSPYYYDAFWLPTNTVPAADHAIEGTTPESYYSFDHGDAHFVALYVPLLFAQVHIEPASAQLRWLEADLAASRKPWKFAFLHHPLLTSNGHRTDDYNYNGVRDCEEVRRALLPLFGRYGVQLVFSGHAHVYERFTPIDGVVAVVDGLGGGPPYGLTELDAASAQFWVRQHCVHVRVDGDALELRAVDADGVTFDRMFLQRAPVPAQTHTASWHSPDLGSTLAGDGDGNRIGQRFDLVGEPIPTAPGDSANLGRIHVNHDRTHLYLGCEEAMLRASQTLFLFLESPGLPGVTTLAGLGNGRIDPTAEGVDGLDLLDNLSFTNFTPGVALVLGDEFADGTFRSWPRTNIVGTSGWPPLPILRTNLALDTGQGAFRLDPGFTTLSGARIEQFNRSPQLSSFAGEQNANYIVAALPLAGLGLRPGDPLRIGGVIATGEFRIDSPQPGLLLDRCFLGDALHGSGWGPVALEGTRVDLGPDLDADADGLLLAEELRLGTDPANADTDGDGLDDGWEVRMRLDPLAATGPNGPDGDPDGDGLTNRQERAAGSDPRDDASPPRLRLARYGADGLRLDWLAVPGGWYRIEWSPTATGPFTLAPVAGLLAGSRQASMVLPGVLTAGETARFYRVVLWP
jgi:3',5'-cyclic AMP phosphodiesterase CpdA